MASQTIYRCTGCDLPLRLHLGEFVEEDGSSHGTDACEEIALPYSTLIRFSAYHVDPETGEDFRYGSHATVAGHYIAPDLDSGLWLTVVDSAGRKTDVRRYEIEYVHPKASDFPSAG